MTSTARAALRLEDVHKSFAGVAALKGVTFEVDAGEVHALLGENGAGKSTLMAIAAGSLLPDAGGVEIGGVVMDTPSPTAAQAFGLGVVYQHPVILDDLSVAENLALAAPPDRRPGLNRIQGWAQQQMTAIEADIDVARRGSELSPVERQLVEIAKALVIEPKVLILDEPTAALTAAEVERLFARVRAIRARGTAVVYITHRIPEVLEIADRLTVLRDGEQRGTFRVADVSEDDIVNLILGRELEAVFPDKPGAIDAPPLLEVEGLSGESFDDVGFQLRPGEIVGLAGAEGNGQLGLLRALAGLSPSTGRVRVGGVEVGVATPRQARRAGIHLIPGDRQREGLFASLSVLENTSASSLERFAAAGFVRPREELEAARHELEAVAVRAPSLQAPVTALSGGNQQKVVFARALLTEPGVLLCDEPTQGVDAGARVEIYRLLRELADAGKAVVVLSSDAVELEGLCDRVLVFSRGHVAAELRGEEVTEERITGAALRSTKVRRTATEAPAVASARRLLRGDFAPGLVILALIVGLGLYTALSSSAYLTEINLQSALFLASALILVSVGQLIVLLTAGIDLSVGPLMALTVVVLSFRLGETQSAGSVIAGVVLIIVVGIGVGLLNGLLVRKARISPIIATLATFIALQGVSQLLRPTPDGVFKTSFVDGLQKGVGFLPWAFVVAVVVAVACEIALRRTRLGLRLRAVGSDETSAHRLGVPVDRTALVGYVLCSLFTVAAGVLLAAQVGIGDATVGVSYTLTSITAVVLGGASIYGGRGSFVSAALGAILLTQIINALTFLNLSEAWQYWLPGALILLSAGLYARARGVKVAALESAA